MRLLNGGARGMPLSLIETLCLWWGAKCPWWGLRGLWSKVPLFLSSAPYEVVLTLLTQCVQTSPFTVKRQKAFLGLCVKLHNENGLCKNGMNVKGWKLWLSHSIGSKQVAEWSMANILVFDSIADVLYLFSPGLKFKTLLALDGDVSYLNFLWDTILYSTSDSLSFLRFKKYSYFFFNAFFS